MTTIAEAPTYTHSGVRYVLGYGSDFVGIWDREHEETPSFRFPKDEEGWRLAFEEFGKLEPKGLEVAPAPFQTSVAPPPAPPPVAAPAVVAGPPRPAWAGQAAARVNPLAVVSLIVTVVGALLLWLPTGVAALGLTGLAGCIVGLVLAGVARRQITRSMGQLSGAWMAITASIIAGITIALFVLLVIVLAGQQTTF